MSERPDTPESELAHAGSANPDARESNPATDSSPVTAGTLLRQAREASGLHIAALAVALKVPVRKLESLEADQLDQLPDAVFVRALTASVCRHLKVDPAPILDRLPRTTAPRLEPSSSSLNSPFRAPGDAPKSAVTHALSKRAMLAVFLLLAGAIVLLLIPQRRAQTTTEVVSIPVPIQPTQPVTAPSVQAAAEPSALEASQPSASPATSAVISAVTAPAAGTPAATAAPLVPAASPAQPAASAVAARPGLVAFSSRGESWVEVTDASGTVTLRRILSAGDSVAAGGVLPLSVVVGRADLTDVTVRGRPLDTARFARDNVARFEVK
jgi:cytoskeleton protein RodZ